MNTTYTKRIICPECGGKRVEVPVNRYMNINTGMFSPIALTAWTCLECGYTSLYAQDLDRLRNSHHNH